MPINKKYNVQELMNAIRKYGEITNNRISFEYKFNLQRIQCLTLYFKKEIVNPFQRD